MDCNSQSHATNTLGSVKLTLMCLIWMCGKLDRKLYHSFHVTLHGLDSLTIWRPLIVQAWSFFPLPIWVFVEFSLFEGLGWWGVEFTLSFRPIRSVWGPCTWLCLQGLGEDLERMFLMFPRRRSTRRIARGMFFRGLLMRIWRGRGCWRNMIESTIWSVGSPYYKVQAVHVVGIRQERKQQIHMWEYCTRRTGAGQERRPGKNNSSYDKLCTATSTYNSLSMQSELDYLQMLHIWI